MVPWKIDTPPLGIFREIYSLPPGLTENSFYRKLFLLRPQGIPPSRTQGSLFENPIFI